LVAIQVDPWREPGQFVHVECRPFYRGVDKKDELGRVQFEVQILPERTAFQKTGSSGWFSKLERFAYLQTLPEVESGPKWDWGWGLGKKPGLELRPRNTDEHIDSNMFILKGGDTNIHPSNLEGEGDLNADYVVRVNKFLTTYKTRPAPEVLGPDPTKPLFKGYQIFDPRLVLGECGDFPFGYVEEGETRLRGVKRVKPCMFIKMNNVLEWQPEPVKCGDPDAIAEDGLPYDDCPYTLIRHLESSHAKAAGDQNIWIDCNGRYAHDKEALDEGISYYPASRAIPLSYFPYLGERSQGGYHSPLVAIQVDPWREPGQFVQVECRPFYRGVDKKDKLGRVQFGVQILPYL